jgi:hypothetical protein
VSRAGTAAPSPARLKTPRPTERPFDCSESNLGQTVWNTYLPRYERFLFDDGRLDDLLTWKNTPRHRVTLSVLHIGFKFALPSDKISNRKVDRNYNLPHSSQLRSRPHPSPFRSLFLAAPRPLCQQRTRQMISGKRIRPRDPTRRYSLQMVPRRRQVAS